MDFQYILIALGIILAICLIYFGFTRFIKNKNFKENVSSTIDIQGLLKALGNKENITYVKSSPSKVTVGLIDHNKIDVEAIQALGASGIVEGKDNLSMIFGQQSPFIEKDLKQYL